MSTVTLDAYTGWSVSRLKRRCMELCMAVDHKDQIIRMLMELIPSAPAAIPESFRDECMRIFTALDD